MDDDNLLQHFPHHAALMRRCLGIRKPTEAEVRAIVEKSVGAERVSRFFDSRTSAESYLTDRAPEMRGAAIITIAHHWGPDDNFKNACERLVLSDSDPVVRKCALACFYSSCRATDKGRVGKVAALLTYDNALPSDLRMYAYRSLVQLYMHKRLTAWYPRSPDSPGFCFPEDVDWKLVDAFLYPQPK